MLDFASRIQLSPDALLREVDGEAVLLNLATQNYFTLNAVGTRMLQTLTQTISIEQAYIALLSEYEADPAELKSDLRELIEKLLEQGLVVVG